MKILKPLYGIVTLLFLGASFSALAGSADGMMPSPPDDGMMGPPPDGPGSPDAMAGPERMAQKLGLSKDQLTKLHEVRQKYVDELKAKREALQVAHDKMHELMSSDKSIDEIKAQHETIKGLRNEFADLHFKIMLETRELLTPEQRAKFASFMDKEKNSPKKHHRHRDDAPAAATPATK